MDNGLSSFISRLPLKPKPLLNKREISPGVFVLRFDRDHSFLPGQVVGITTEQSIPPRLYSICSGKEDAFLEILFNIKTEGILTPILAQLQEGDLVSVSKPFGSFLGDDQPAWWIAAGTGVAPYRSMLRSGLGQNKKLIHGGRTADSFYFHDEMKAAFGAAYIRCCSQESSDDFYNGRLTNWLREQKNIPTDQNFYLCGSAEMVVEVRDILISKGVAIEKLMSEIYF
ncbi:MAG: oxidoreductase [Bacteroidetes bacterium]|nr:oxidoreductase [Bacteroidota bacterium]MBU1580448.1 oxidoreductase [Bacteroidota bacterium]MBU2465090.1 oxidoreductase [Bacteroidota bacterium]MBU2558800.1 oxidoreductase [Bacteroidota bacterium]